MKDGRKKTHLWKRALTFLLLVSMCLPLLKGIGVTVKAAKKPAPTSVKLSQTKLTLTAGKTKKLTCKVKPVGANTKVTWSSDNPAVATVSSKGVVKGIKAGTATVTVKATGNKKKAKCKVTVTKAKTQTISATIRFWNYTGKQIDELYFEDSGAADYGDEYLESKGFQCWSANEYIDVPLKFKTSASLDFFIRCSDDTEYEATGLSLNKAAAKDTIIELTSSEVVLKVNNKKVGSAPFEKKSMDPIETPAVSAKPETPIVSAEPETPIVSTEPDAADLVSGNKNYSNIKIDNIKKNGNYLVGFDVSYKTADSIGTAPGRISINTQVFKASYPDNSYGDFTDMGKYAKTHSYTSFPAAPADCGFVTWNAPFAKGDSAYYDGTASFKRPGYGATQKLTVVFPENTILLDTEKTFYVYLWSNYNKKTYPDAFLYTFTTNKGDFMPEGISDEDWDALQDNYASLVNAYNEVANLYNSEEIKADKDIEELMAQAKSLIEEMGEIKRGELSASQGQELNGAIKDIAEALLGIIESMETQTKPDAADLVPGNKNYSNIKIDNIKKNGNYLVGFDVSYKTAPSIAAAPGRISINTQVFKASYPDNSYGDFTDMGKYAKAHSYTDFPATPADCGFVTWNAPFAKGDSAYYDGTASFKRSGYGATQKLTVVFPENTILLNTEKTYYVYLWGNYNKKTYPDAFLYTFTTNKGDFVPEGTNGEG